MLYTEVRHEIFFEKRKAVNFNPTGGRDDGRAVAPHSGRNVVRDNNFNNRIVTRDNLSGRMTAR